MNVSSFVWGSSIEPTFTSSESSQEISIEQALHHFEQCANLQQRNDHNKICLMDDRSLEDFLQMPEEYREKYTHVTEMNQVQENVRKCQSAFDEVVELVKKNPTVESIQRLALVIKNRQLFDCTQIVQVLIFLQPLLQSDIILKKVASRFFFTDEDSGENRAKNALWCACYFGDVSMVEEALTFSPDINAPLYGETSPIFGQAYPLLTAISQGNEEVAHFLIEKGADVRCIGGTHHHKTPLSEALNQGNFSPGFMKILVELDGGFTQKFEAKKRIAHLFSSITPQGKFSIQGKEFMLRGYRPRAILELYVKSSRAFYEDFKKELMKGAENTFGEILPLLSEETQEKLKTPEIRERLCLAIDDTIEAMKHALQEEKEHQKVSSYTKEHDIKRVEDDFVLLEQNKPVISFNISKISFEDPELHAWGFVSFKNSDDSYTISKCDRGVQDKPGIFSKKTSKENLTSLKLDYLRAIKWKTDFQGRTGSSIYKEFIHQFSGPDSEYVREKKQTIGNCCYYTAQSLELACFIGLFGKVVGNSHDAEVMGKFVKNQRSQRDRGEELVDQIGSYRSFVRVSPPVSSSSGASSSSPSSITMDHEDEVIFTNIYYNALQNKKMIEIMKSLSHLQEDFEKHLQDQALVAAWGRLRNHLPGVEKRELTADEIREVLKDNSDAIRNVKTLNLSGLILKVFPQELHLFTELQELNLRQCSLKIIPPLHFQHMKKLNLSQNKIQKFEDFYLPELEELSLESNQLNECPRIERLRQLKTLNLFSNHLREIPLSLLTTIESLNLSNNLISGVDLSSLTQLRDLRLSNNPLRLIPRIYSLKLKNLYLENCSLNSLTEEDEEMLNRLTELEWINLSNNQLPHKPQLSLPKLENMVLYNNTPKID